jgi:site-specific DNA-methyltransferase (adenine-specific)
MLSRGKAFASARGGPDGAVRLLLGDAADVLQDLPARSVDMVYADPPFDTGKVWTGRSGSFDDRWSESDRSRRGWEALRGHDPLAADLVWVACQTAGRRGFIGVMAEILLGVRRVLKLTGSLWLHFDDTAGAHLRILCDAVFGFRSGLGTIVWRRTNAHSATGRCFGRVHDTIAVHARSQAAAWRLWRIDRQVGDPITDEVRLGGLIEGANLTSTSRERVGYPTQKPAALIARFIKAATLAGDLVLDPTCGSASSLVAARDLGRRAIGIDVSPAALETAGRRLGLLNNQQLEAAE